MFKAADCSWKGGEGWVRTGHSIPLGGFFPDTAQRLRADLGTAADERHFFHLRKYFVVI